MRKICLGLMVATTAISAAGCVINDNNTNNAVIGATWQFKDVATGQTTGCPVGFDTAAVIAQPIQPDGTPVGNKVIDLFDCVAGSGQAKFPPGLYNVFVQIESNGGGSVYGASLSADLDISSVNKTINVTLFNDGGFFELAWNLKGEVSGSPLSCTQAGNPASIEILSTISGTTSAKSDKFTCADGSGITNALLAGAYTISIAALNTSDQSIGTAPAASATIHDRNGVTSLTAQIPIQGL